MASACVNNNISVSPESFPSYGWLSPGRSSRMSFSRKPSSMAEDEADIQDPVDFEFRLEDPVTMLPADELFSDASLATTRSTDESTKPCMDPYLFSPKAPRCSSRWKELLGLKKLYQNSKSENHSKTTPSNPPPKSSIKHFLHRSSSLESSLSLPLLKDLSDSETVSLSSSRLSLSSSSSGHEHEDLPRLSLDSDKPGLSPSPNPFANPPRMRIVKHRDSHNQPHNTNTTHVSRAGRSPMRRETAAATSRGVSVDSPRLNSSGKIVFQSLERSSSSPSSFNGGPRFKHRGMERSYSANVRITPVLNVPVCSLRGSSKSGSVFGFGQLFSSQQKSGNGNGVRQQNNSRNRTDRT
ncbi:hypothetical protein Pint_04979 [Pistacia integerrima]|uniref:Uncharacterized protein n=1 Tax=Pistacia integerrima TaxID=434235 RepID=A0ACC0Z3Y4_9ROSI|nr:hypothetical protein Pint_04979 [Pistacia integerrima]